MIATLAGGLEKQGVGLFCLYVFTTLALEITETDAQKHGKKLREHE